MYNLFHKIISPFKLYFEKINDDQGNAQFFQFFYNKSADLIILFLIICMYFFCSQMLRELIPGDLIKVQNTAEWKRLIVATYNQDIGLSIFLIYLSCNYWWFFISIF